MAELTDIGQQPSSGSLRLSQEYRTQEGGLARISNEMHPRYRGRRFKELFGDAHEHCLKDYNRRTDPFKAVRELCRLKKKEKALLPSESALLAESHKTQSLSDGQGEGEQYSKHGAEAPSPVEEKYGTCKEIIGRGTYGIVMLSHKNDPEKDGDETLYAVKIFRKKPHVSDRSHLKRLTGEFCIASCLQNRNVVTTLDLVLDSKGNYCQVLEYCCGGNLRSLILRAAELEIEEADCFFKQLIRGVNYLHDMGVSHRDLKPENLLLTARGALKISDFGTSECFRLAWETEAHMSSVHCGTAAYDAPEEYLYEEFDPRPVDIWATGIIYMAMRTGRLLWGMPKHDKDRDYQQYLIDRRSAFGYAPFESLQTTACRNVIYSILDPFPGRRLTSQHILRSQWVHNIKVCEAGEQGL